MHGNINPEEDLNAALDTLHLVFDRYRGSDNWDDALDQLSELERTAPKRLSLIELSDEQVDYFFSHAVCQFSKSEQQKLPNQIAATKYFLQRSLDVLCRLSDPHVPQPIGMAFEDWWIIEQMNRAQWRSWPDEEREIVERVLLAWYTACFHFTGSTMQLVANQWYYRRRSAFEAFCVLRQTGVPISSLLNIAKRGKTATIAEFVSTLVGESMAELAATYYLWPAAEVPYDDQRPFVQWMMHPSLTARLEAFFFEGAESPGLLRRLSETVQNLTHIRQVWENAEDAPQWVRALFRGVKHD